jgi:hypothetical protein
MTQKVFPTIEKMESVNAAIESAQAREVSDKHLTDAERETLVQDFESVFGINSYGYPVDGDTNIKFVYIIFDWS